MAVVYPVSMPTAPNFTNFSIEYDDNTAVHESPISKVTQVLARPGDKWAGSYTLPSMRKDLALVWTAFLSSLRGRYGTFYGFDPDHRSPSGNGGAEAPLVAGAQNSQTLALDTDGWTPSTAGLLLPGDYIEVPTATGPELKKVLNQVDSDGLGAATIDIAPPMHKGVADNAAIVLINPRGKFRLTSKGGWSTDKAIRFGITFAFEEALTDQE